MSSVGKLILHELKELLRNPALLVLILLPVFMSKVIIGVMNLPDQEQALLASWILFAQVMIGIMLAGPNMIEERESKTIDALLLTPLSFRTILLSKGITILLLSLLSQFFVYLVNRGPLEYFLPVFGMMLLGGILFVQVGLFIGLKINSSKNGAAVSSIFMVSFFLLGSIYKAIPNSYGYLKWIPSVSIVENNTGLLQGHGYLGMETGIVLFWNLLVVVLLLHQMKKSS